MWGSLIVGCVDAVIFTFTSITLSDFSWWEILLIAICPPLLGLIGDILVNKGIITKEQKDAEIKKVDNVVGDFKDNGKIDDSNKEEK